MRTSALLGIVGGFLLTLFVGVGLPFAFLMMPAAGMFLGLVPVWTIGTIVVFLFGSIATGRGNFAIGTVLAAFLIGGMFYAKIISPFRAITAECRRGYVDIQPPSNKEPTNVIFDNVSHDTVRQFSHNKVMRSLIKKFRVFEIERDKGGVIKGSWEFSIEDIDGCTGPGKGKSVILDGVPKPVVYCLMKTKSDEPSSNAATLVIRGFYASDEAENNVCRNIDVIERSNDGEKKLGRFRYNRRDATLVPLPDGLETSHDNWLIVIVRAVFGMEFGLEDDSK